MTDTLELGRGFYLECVRDKQGREVVYLGSDFGYNDAVIGKEKASKIVWWLTDRLKLSIVGRVTIEALEEEE